MNRNLYRGKSYTEYIKEELDSFYNKKAINESSKSRIYSQLSDTSDTRLAIISACRPDKDRTTELRRDVLDLGYGYVSTVSRWVNEDGTPEDETSLIIYGISLDEALDLGVKYEQDAIIYKDDDGLRMISTSKDPESSYKFGQEMEKFNNSGNHILNIADAEKIFAKQEVGPVTKAKGVNAPFTLKSKETVKESLNVFVVETGNTYSIFKYEPELQRII